MKDSKKTKAEILSELESLRARVREMESHQNGLRRNGAREKEARAYFKSIVDTVRQPLVVLDSNLHVISANRFFYRTFGGTKQQTENKLIYELGDRQWDIPELRKLLEEILPKHNHFHDFEVDHEFPNIGRRTMLLNGRQIYSEDIGSNMILLAIEDITERKRAEEALCASLDRYRSYIDVAGQLGWTTNGDGEVVEDIPSFRKFTGQTYEEVKGWGWINALHPDDVKHTEDVWKKAITSKSRYEVEYRIRRHDGTYRHFMARGIPVFEEKGGRIREWIGTCIDITERKRAEEALRNSLAESQRRSAETLALLQSSRAILKYQELEAAERTIFDSCKRLLGATAGYIALLSEDGTQNEVLFLDSGGLPCTVDPNLPMPIRGLRAEAYKLGKPVYENGFASSEWESLLPPGHVRLDSVLFAPLRLEGKTVGVIGLANKAGGFSDEDGRLAGAFANHAAIALQNSLNLEALRESEGRYRNLSENLEEEVKKKVVELRQAQTLAALGQMVSVVAHEIRSPLQTIRMGVQAIRKKRSEDKSNLEILGEIDYGVSSLNGIVKELLEYSKPVKLEYDSWPIRDIVNQALDSMNNTLCNITVELALGKERKEINLDAPKMVRVLVNLISNAAEAMPKGGNLRISSQLSDHNGEDVLKLSISDTGCGIDEKDLERVHEPFFTTKRQGTGLGIPICRKIIEAHGGSFGIKSKVNKGTTVEIELPVKSS